jgi:hypothetical protein
VRVYRVAAEIPFVDLDECEIEPSLARLISESYARHLERGRTRGGQSIAGGVKLIVAL